jgi:hypothetical protein
MLDYSLIETGFGFNQEIVVKGSLGESYRFSSKGPLQATTQPKSFSHLNEATFFLRRYCIGGSGSIISQLYATFANDPAPWQHDLDEQIDGLSRLLMNGQFFAYSTEVRAPVPEHIKPNMPLAGTAAKMEGSNLNRSASNTLGPGGEDPENILEDLDLYCALPDDSPAADLPYTVTMADGTVLRGTLDKKGEKHLPNLKPNSVDVEFGEQPDEAAIAATRKQISSVLDNIIADERAEKETLTATYDELNVAEKGLVSIGSLLTGFGKAGVDLVKSTAELAYNLAEFASPLRPLKQALNASWKAYNADDSHSWTSEFVTNWSDSEHQAYVKALGFDPSAITKEQLTEAYEIASFICADFETQDLLTDFVADYASAQHHTELTEMGGAAVFDIVLTVLLVALTGGAGNAAMAAKKTSKLKKLAAPFKKLTQQLKKKNRFKTKSGHTGGRVEQKIGKPDGAELNKKQTEEQGSRKIARNAAEDRAEITRLSKAGNIEAARDILRQHIPKAPSNNWDDFIERLDIDNPKDGAVFWSGDDEAALKYARSIGGTTLEGTPGGSVINGWDELKKLPWNEDKGPPPWSGTLWETISTKFANGATGKVSIVQKAEKLWDQGTVWHNVEKDIIKRSLRNGKVTDIEIFVLRSDGSATQLSPSYVNDLMKLKGIPR